MDFAELLCGIAVFEDEDLAVVLVVLGVVFFGTLMVVLISLSAPIPINRGNGDSFSPLILIQYKKNNS